ncbi:hypothetical protein [Aquimarina sp. RZ0]|uniref:hypothetical protein n=1 Tax=Aquimarina sp. RZ0 TaxID=2607730 RepID=UPI0011F38949|nr:hypothetical protein [Aquimarina sp. RZ0]KAA1245887.1 hypothetical protein F0000_10025 [Aquimarina sp. RZ0]
MKKLLLNCIFVLSSVVIVAQEIRSTSTGDTLVNENVYQQTKFSKTPTLITEENTSIKVDKICYGEISKVTYYEALISQNGFDINLKNSSDLVIKNTEAILSNKKDMIRYSVNDQ